MPPFCIFLQLMPNDTMGDYLDSSVVFLSVCVCILCMQNMFIYNYLHEGITYVSVYT